MNTRSLSPPDLILTPLIFLLPLPLPFAVEDRILVVAVFRIILISLTIHGFGVDVPLLSMKRWLYILPSFLFLLIAARFLHITSSLTPSFPLLFSLSLLPAAISEELFFRGYLISRLNQLHISPPLTIAISLLSFAGGHSYQGYAGFIFSLIAAEILIFLRQKTHGLLASTITHWGYNLATLYLYSSIPEHIMTT